MNSPFQLQIHFTNDCNWIYAFIVKFKIRRHIWLQRRNSKNPNNLQKNSLCSKRYITSNKIVMKTTNDASKNNFCLASSISTGLMPDRAQTIWDLSFHSGNNYILFTSTGTRACMRVGTSLFMDRLWDFHLLGLVVKIYYDYFIYQSKLLLQQFWNLVTICHHHVSCKQYDCLHVWHPWDQISCSSKSDACFYYRESVSSCFWSIISTPSMPLL